MDLEFPIEFIVSGTPVSLQSSTKAKNAWKNRVLEAFKGTQPDPHFFNETDEFSVIIRYFAPAARDETSPDIDNINKPILDALSRNLYRDDSQISRLEVLFIEPDKVVLFTSPSEVLQAAMDAEPPVVYIKIDDRPFEGL